MRTIFLIIALSFLIPSRAKLQTITNVDLNPIFNEYEVEGCFAAYIEQKNQLINYNSSRCDSLFFPASTFKIVNTIIAMEEGVITDTNKIYKWDGHKWPNPLWNCDQTIRSAIKNSCVWVFRDISVKIPPEVYTCYLENYHYGNMKVNTDSSLFWLNGPLKISANQQVLFLKKLYTFELDISMENIRTLKELLLVETAKYYKLYGKTGKSQISKDKFIMWFVGILEMHFKTVFFALNYTADVKNIEDNRQLLVKKILDEYF